MRETATFLYVHLVWGTWDRLPLLVGEAKDAVYSCLHQECVALKTDILALGGVADHIHLLVSMPPILSVAGLVKQLKGSSSHLANHAPGVEFFKWQGAYGATSVWPIMIPQIISYIENQERHHHERTTEPAYEFESAKADFGFS